MPYGTRKSGSKTQVVNKRSGKVYGTHSSKEKARKQLAALHIHTDESAEPSLASFFEGESTDLGMARASRDEEEQAIRDYTRRERDAEDTDLKRVFRHARGEEEEHSDELQKWMGEAKEDIPDPDENSHLPDPEEEGEEFVKTAPIHAVQMEEPFEVETVEGPMDGKAGDWLAKGHNGDMWVVDDELFRDTHEPAGEEQVEEASTAHKTQHAPEPDPQSYQTFQSPMGYHLLTPDGNEQWFDTAEKRDRYLQWHQSLSGIDRSREVQPSAPKMAEVFRVSEAPISNRPPPGSQVVKPTEWNQLGSRGQSLKQGLNALQQAGQPVKAYKTPAGDQIAYPDSTQPGQTPFKADTTKGIWTPVTGSAAGTPTTATSPTTTAR